MEDLGLAKTELQSLWAERGIVETELAPGRGGTIVRRMDDAAPVSWSTVVHQLPPVHLEGGPPLVSLGDVLGRGGMGEVRSGRQPSIDRDVAVKVPLPGATDSGIQALMREAWITGQLEHPNIIPVHALYRQGDAPLLVMKRVEGHEWSEQLRSGGSLEAHLRTLTQVCHAVHFAHTRGFVHLDLKPDNVMVGGFGEIYLLDWGIAASLRADVPDFIPRAQGLCRVMGTPAYMAPELASGSGKIDARTDVYLLGAVLHEVLTGRPPHTGETLVEILQSAFASKPPDWPAAVPQELGAIAGRALARDPDDRFASVAELREAIEDYLVHADSLHLAAAARERFEQIKAAITSGEGEAEVDRLAGEAEFGFRQALDVWPANDDAKTALQQLLELLIERDLAEKRWQLAARRLAALPSPRPELAARVNELRESSSSMEDELRRRRAETDLSRAASQRGTLAYLLALIWGGGLIVVGQVGHHDLVRIGYLEMFLVTASGLVAFAGLIVGARKQLLSNTVNRNAIAVLAVGWVLGVAYWLALWVAVSFFDAQPFDAAVVGIAPLTAYVIGAGAAGVDRRLFPHALVAMSGGFLSAFAPGWALEILGTTGAVTLVMLGRTWRGDARKAPAA
ncbi:MAG: protein kinase [Myxococcales bacterium]|nr:protein kinase [Myxococcales bacterium]